MPDLLSLSLSSPTSNSVYEHFRSDMYIYMYVFIYSFRAAYRAWVMHRSRVLLAQIDVLLAGKVSPEPEDSVQPWLVSLYIGFIPPLRSCEAVFYYDFYHPSIIILFRLSDSFAYLRRIKRFFHFVSLHILGVINFFSNDLENSFFLFFFFLSK